MKKVLAIMLAAIMILLSLGGCSKKEKLFPIEMTEENIEKIEIERANNGAYVLNEKDTKKAIKDINKLYKVDKYPEDEMPNAGANDPYVRIIIYTNKGKITISPTKYLKNKGVGIVFNMNDFPGEFDYVNLPGGENVTFYAQGIGSNSILKYEYLSKMIDKYGEQK